MSFFSQTKSKKEQTEEQRRRRRGEHPSTATRWFSARQVVFVLCFLAMTGLVTAVCFVGQSPGLQQMVVDKHARVRVVADRAFSFESDSQTQNARALAGQQISSSYRLDPSGEAKLRQAMPALQSTLDQYSAVASNLTADEQTAAAEKLARDFSQDHGLTLEADDVPILTGQTTSKQREQAIEEGLSTVRAILSRGIVDATQPEFQGGGAGGGLYNVFISGRNGTESLQSEDDALHELREDLAINAETQKLDDEAQAALFRLMRQVIKPNIQFDLESTRQNRERAVAAVQPVVVQVEPGEVIIDPSSPVTDDQRERLEAYLAQPGETQQGVSSGLSQRYLFVALLLAAAVIFIKSGLGQLEQSPKLYALAALLLVLDLALLRLVLGLGDTALFAPRPQLIALLPWAAPTMLAPLLVAVLVGAAPAVLTALLVSILFSVMTGDTLEVFLVNFLVSLVAIHFAREVRVRARLVRAGLMGGLAAAVCAAYLGFLGEPDLGVVGRQMLTAAVTGLLTAVVAIGLLPVLENLFQITTDITLLELTDYNHRLLRKLQIAAPGTYHHSLMVANLAERAAAEIGANALLCRACSLYHDIGKIVKPEYFTENQRDDFSPHDEVNPSMSALVIKSHVKEGLDLARQHKLPLVVQDVIAQHHGTTLIKFFHQKALLQQRLLPPAPPRAKGQARGPAFPLPAAPPAREEPVVDESFYRYDGPCPRFKESAIIALADCVEAASRSLRKVTPLAVQELIEALVNDRLEDHQLDECPITILELTKIKQSFHFTLLNMLHSRVQYSGDTHDPAAPAAKDATPPASAPTPPPGRAVPAAASVRTASA